MIAAARRTNNTLRVEVGLRIADRAPDGVYTRVLIDRNTLSDFWLTTARSCRRGWSFYLLLFRKECLATGPGSLVACGQHFGASKEVQSRISLLAHFAKFFELPLSRVFATRQRHAR